MKTEKEIVEDVKKGMASAFDNLYEAYSHKLYLFANSILNKKVVKIIHLIMSFRNAMPMFLFLAIPVLNIITIRALSVMA